MATTRDYAFVIATLKTLFPNAECELVHHNAFELLVAVALSAQTTDAAVNTVTPALFERYPTPEALATADVKDVEQCISRIGLYRNKAKNLIGMSQLLVKQFNGEVPSRISDLMTLPGCGRKTASVVQSVWFKIPSVPVDTHVERICKRLYIAKPEDSVLEVEKKFKRKIPRTEWNEAHHLFIFFGRYFCTARNPKCSACAFTEQCRYYKNLNK